MEGVGCEGDTAVLLQDRTAVIYGAGGSIGAAVARAYAREGARVHLAGRTRESLERVAAQIRDMGGVAETTQVDALDESAVSGHADAVVARSGRVDICMNVISYGDMHGTPLAEMTLEDFERPVRNAVRSQFLTCGAAWRLSRAVGSRQRSEHVPRADTEQTGRAGHDPGGQQQVPPAVSDVLSIIGAVSVIGPVDAHRVASSIVRSGWSPGVGGQSRVPDAGDLHARNRTWWRGHQRSGVYERHMLASVSGFQRELRAAVDAEDWGRVLRAYRRMHGVSQSYVAALCGLSQPDVSAI